MEPSFWKEPWSVQWRLEGEAALGAVRGPERMNSSPVAAPWTEDLKQ